MPDIRTPPAEGHRRRRRSRRRPSHEAARDCLTRNRGGRAGGTHARAARLLDPTHLAVLGVKVKAVNAKRAQYTGTGPPKQPNQRATQSTMLAA